MANKFQDRRIPKGPNFSDRDLAFFKQQDAKSSPSAEFSTAEFASFNRLGKLDGHAVVEKLGKAAGFKRETSFEIFHNTPGVSAELRENFQKNLRESLENDVFQTFKPRVSGLGRSFLDPISLRNLEASRQGLVPSRRFRGLFQKPGDDEKALAFLAPRPRGRGTKLTPTSSVGDDSLLGV